MKKKLLVTFLILISIVLIIYTWLGGFQKAVVKRAVLPNNLIMGKEYYGLSKSENLGEIFGEVQTLLAEGKVKGVPAVVYYSMKNQNEDSVHAFVGTLVRDSTSQSLPPKYKYIYLKAQNGLQATLNAHAIVLSPEKIAGAHQSINDFAKRAKIKLKPLVIEKYVGDKEFLMEIPIEE